MSDLGGCAPLSELQSRYEDSEEELDSPVRGHGQARGSHSQVQPPLPAKVPAISAAVSLETSKALKDSQGSFVGLDEKEMWDDDDDEEEEHDDDGFDELEAAIDWEEMQEGRVTGVLEGNIFAQLEWTV